MSTDLDILIADYRKHAKEHSATTADGDYREANVSYDKLIELLHTIIGHGDAGSAALAALMDDDNDSVRCWAATHSLRYHRIKAEGTLAELASGYSIVALNAEMVLEEWNKGTLELP